MSWVTVIWSLNAGACLTLAAFYGAVWCFCVDAAITVWRRGDRQRALLVGGSMIFGAILAWHVPLVIWGLARATRFTRELEVSEKRFNLAADSANLGMWEWALEKDEIWVTPTRRAQLGFAASGRITFEDLISRWHADDRVVPLKAQPSLSTIS